MKTTVAVTALLASIAFAQPYHGRHLHKKDLHKRKLVTVTTTCIETATLLIDQDGTTLIEPTPAQFYPSTTSDDTTSTTSTSTSSTSTPMSKPTTLSTSTTSTSAYVQPQPTTPTQAQETTPTTTPEAPAYTQTTSEAAAPTSGSGSGSSGSGGSYSGDITFYEIGLGSCGIDSSGQNPSGTSPSDPAVIALPKPQMEVWTGNPNSNPLCGKIIKITANGKTGYGKVLDTCGDCLPGSIDTNEGAFSVFYDPSKGRAPVSWEFM